MKEDNWKRHRWSNNEFSDPFWDRRTSWYDYLYSFLIRLNFFNYPFFLYYHF